MLNLAVVHCVIKTNKKKYESNKWNLIINSVLLTETLFRQTFLLTQY